MARIRTIKPEFPQSESMGRVSRDARLLFVNLWTICDDEGKSRGNSRMLASLLYPYDDDAKDLIEGWLSELEREKCITRYLVDGAIYLQISKWLEHQKIDKPSKSRLPQFDEASRSLSKPLEHSTTDLGPRTMDLGPKESKGRKGACAPRFEIPDWIPLDPWEAFEEMRAKIRKPMTNRARELIVGRLDCLRKSGCDPGAVLLQSVENSWQGVFPIKDQTNAIGRRHSGEQPTKHQRLQTAFRRAAVAGGYAPDGFDGQEETGDDAGAVLPIAQALRQGT